ncbi:MAG TPA: NAD(P)/FAD-dependent oxidoreductase, partial [Acetobacteraceae bacterium]|nr:NAD(P)/FAD-dependent oxidoreductase [Acetobacteraceae bacterium]
ILAAPLLATPFIARAQTAPHVIVVGGGFAGATAARFLRRINPTIDVLLIEPNAIFVACPFSNEVIAGLRDIDAQRFIYDGLAADGIRVVQAAATEINPTRRSVAFGSNLLLYDRLILAPGIDIDWSALPGYDESAANRMPHAWKAGEQTILLRRQLEAMPDGGVVVMSAPPNPFRCPPGPYERASLIAYYLKTQKPRSKLILLDAKDSFSKQKLFQQAWQQLYPGLLEWVSLSDGGKVTRVDPATNTFETDFGSHKADVANVIPPQRAGAIAAAAGVADRTGWCPIDPVTFESKLQPNIHVVGDAAIAGAMPKSAFAANAQAKVCAEAVAALLAGNTPQGPKLINTCYSLAAPDYGFSIAGVYHPAGGQLTDIEGAGGTSPLNASAEQRALEAKYAEAWFKTITNETFG